jgi:3-deoxy-D-manno-octulosonate 8-phosphate phosphatase KdsC-like HAD superfamily phosphatase
VSDRIQGITSKKDSIKAELAKLTDCHCGELHNLGDDTNDNNLMEQNKVSVSALEKMPNTELLLKAQAVLELLRTHSEALVSYDVSAEEIDEFAALVKKYTCRRVQRCMVVNTKY